MGKKKKKRKPSQKLALFFERLEQIVGTSVFGDIKTSFTARPTTFRVNTLKATRQEVIDAVTNSGLKIEQVVWYKDAFILKNGRKRDLTDLEVYKQGKIYIQSLASMVPPLVMDLKPGQKVLDLTAAPGSKTSQIAALMNRTGELYGNDVNEIRFARLEHNMEHLGVTNNLDDENEDINNWKFELSLEHGKKLINNYPKYFDRMLLDAPCSAEARFDIEDSKTYAYWNEKKIKDMAYTQRQLLLSAWSALKPGGILVYSTCTMAPEENEEQINRLLEKFEDAEILDIDLKLKKLPVILEWKDKIFSKKINKTLRVYPTKQIEGFYVAKIRKCDKLTSVK